MNSIWLVIGSLAAFAVAYRLYGAFLKAKVLALADSRITPAHTRKDGVDYHPTKRLVLFGHHFAAIAGPGPLIGPVLAAQWGWAPSFLWIVIGACLAGGAHDLVVLMASVRMGGKTLPQIARHTLGPAAGIIASIATLFIIVTVLASVASVVVEALGKSSWGLFTVLCTIPAAILTGLWMYKIRPGKVAEASAIGVALVLVGVFLGQPFADSAWGHHLLLEKKTLALLLPAYAFVTACLPVWLLMCPRDYLSSYMKIGVMVMLAVGLVVVMPTLRMPALTPFVQGGGPVAASSGPVWPFICIVIMCGALSGFHALIASGTTPKMMDKESDALPIGYGAMLVEGFVSVTALIAACSLHPGDYLAINAAPTALAPVLEKGPQALGFDPRPVELAELEASTHETLANRPGGAVTLAVGMARIFASLPGMSTLTAYWYHFIIMFEALFILTLLETGTRVARFVFEEVATQFRGKPDGETMWESGETVGETPAEAAAHAAGRKPNWWINISLSALVCVAWGYLLYRGDLGTLWKMLGIANQLLAALALAVGTVWLLQNASRRAYAWVTGGPLVVVLGTVFWAGTLSVRNWWLAAGADGIPGPQAFQLRLMCALASIMMVLTAVLAAIALRKVVLILRQPSTP